MGLVHGLQFDRYFDTGTPRNPVVKSARLPSNPLSVCSVLVGLLALSQGRKLSFLGVTFRLPLIKLTLTRATCILVEPNSSQNVSCLHLQRFLKLPVVVSSWVLLASRPSFSLQTSTTIDLKKLLSTFLSAHIQAPVLP